MKKNLFIVLLLILCNFSVITIKSNYKDENIDYYICENSDLMYDDILCRKEASKNTLRPIMAENKYILTDVIELTFSLETTDYSTISSIDYNLDGFEFDKDLEIENNVITIKLLVDETSDVHRVTITVHLSNLSLVTSKIYGYINDNYIYLSGCSFEAARDIYLTEALANSIITQREYEDIINYRFESDEIISNEPGISFLSNYYSINGTLQWQDDSGNIHPLQYIYVSLYCANDSYDNQLRTTYTDQNGFYNFTISSSSGSITSDNFYIKVRPIGTNVTVDTGTGGNYIWRSSINDRNISGNNITINRTFNMRNIDDLIDGVAGDGDLGRAFQISQALIYADKFAAVMNGSSLNRIRACYPVSDSTDYHPFWKRIDLLGIESDYDYADWDVIFHEYGHHVQNILGNANSSGGRHSSYTDLSLSHGIDEGTRLAWGEAWPTIFGEIAQQYYSTYLSSIAGVADGGYTDSGNRIYSYPLPSFKYNEISNVLYNNEAIERAIMGVLYDLYDSDSDELHDNVVLGARGWWSATVVSGITTFTNFSDQYYSSLNNEIDKINYCKLVQYYGMPATLYDYTTNGTIILAKYKLVGDCSIPKKIFNYIIYSIGEEAFKNQSLLTSVEMFDNSITNIDSSAFENCTSLSNISLSLRLYAIGTSAFKGCTSLESVTLPISVQYIDAEAFRNCAQLTSVNVEREALGLTNLGTNVFAGCNSNLQITVPINRVCEYKNKSNWVMYKTKIVPSNNDYSEITLNCLSESYNLTTLTSGHNKLYKLNVECAKSYKIFTSDNVGVHYIIYNSAMDSVASGQNTVTTYLGVGTYYLTMEFEDTFDSGMIATNYKLAWLNQGENISCSGASDVKAHLHQTGQNSYTSKLKYYNSVSGFYKVALTGYDVDGNEIVYPDGMITIYSDAARTHILDRYNITNNVNYAINEYGENIMYLYLPEEYCYINVCTTSDNFSSLTLSITSTDEIAFDYLRSINTISQNNIFEQSTDYTYFKQVTISHRSKFILEVLPDMNLTSSLSVLIFKKLRDLGYEPGDNHYYIEPEYITNLTLSNGDNELTIILDAGTYYFGYTNNNGMSLIFSLARLVDYSEDMFNTLITDPGAGFELGSEVRYNNGRYRGLTITEGFTRNLFFSQEYIDNTEVSRLDYDWYSSNPNIAEVSEFGTVLGKNVSTDTCVFIYAVNKVDPSIIYTIELEILDETSCDEIEIYGNLSYSYSQENGLYQLELDFSNSPYPYIQYYSWTVDGVTIDASLYWGYVTATGPGIVSLTGIYWLNPRVHIFITLTITD